MRLIDKLKVGVGLQDEWEHNFEGVLSEGLAHANSLATEERSKAHRMMMRLRFFESFRPVGIVVGAPLVLVVMELIDINH